MKTLGIALFLLFPFVATATDAPVGLRALKHPPGPKLEISVKPTSAGAYLVSTVISDRTTGEVFASPSLTVEPGIWATVEIGPAAGAPASSLAVSVAPNGRGAAYFAEFRRDGGIIDTQSGTLIIAR